MSKIVLSVPATHLKETAKSAQDAHLKTISSLNWAPARPEGLAVFTSSANASPAPPHSRKPQTQPATLRAALSTTGTVAPNVTPLISKDEGHALYQTAMK